MPEATSPFLDVLRWVQIIESMLFPVLLVVLLLLAWLDFRRLVNFRIRQGEENRVEEELEKEAKEFSE